MYAHAARCAQRRAGKPSLDGNAPVVLHGDDQPKHLCVQTENALLTHPPAHPTLSDRSIPTEASLPNSLLLGGLQLQFSVLCYFRDVGVCWLSHLTCRDLLDRLYPATTRVTTICRVVRFVACCRAGVCTDSRSARTPGLSTECAKGARSTLRRADAWRAGEDQPCWMPTVSSYCPGTPV